MVDIDLDQENTYKSGEDEVVVSKVIHGTNFQKITYKINYSKQFDLSLWNLIYSSNPYDVHIKFRKTRNPFIYYCKKDDHIIREVETYYSKQHSNIPLIIGFKRDDTPNFRYYTFLFLRSQRYHTGFPTNDYFCTEHLEERLKKENDTRNKIRFVTLQNKSQNYKFILDEVSESEFTRYEYKAEDDEKYVYHQVSKDKLLTEKLSDATVINKLLGEMDRKHFDSIIKYCTKPDNILLFFEFIDDIGSSIFFSRKDSEGYFWEKQSFNYKYRSELNSHFRSIKNQFKTNISYQLENNKVSYNKEKIKIEEQKQPQMKYTKLTHKLSDINLVNKTYLLYNGTVITIVKNEESTLIQNNLESNSIQNSKFTEISTYFLDNKPNEHLLIKLTKHNGDNYYIHRFNKEGTKWRQLTKAYLENAGIEINLEKVDQVMDGHNYINVKILLDYIRFEINSLIILLDKKNPYGNFEIDNIVGTSGSEKEIPPININNNSIKVTNGSKNIFDCIKEKKYCAYDHSLTYVSSKRPKDAVNGDMYLRFYLYNHRIQLYENSNATGLPTYLTYHQGKNELYVYFYGESSNIPLLMCYNDKAYRTKDKDTYFSKWILDNSVKSCVCQGNNIELTNVLDQTQFSNVIYLYEKVDSQRDYEHSKIFYWRLHQRQPKGGDIDVYKKIDGKKLILRPNEKYSSSSLSYSQAYFNRYDDTYTPLILLLTLSGIRERPYYELSKFDNDLIGQTKLINTLNYIYSDYKSLLTPLMNENDKLQDFLTFNIEKTTTSINSKYNDSKIKLELDQKIPSDISTSWFKRYKHTPEFNHINKKGCVIYKNNTLMDKTVKPITDIQGKLLKKVNVYFSNKIPSEPLLAGFEVQENSLEWKYFYQKRQPRGLYWQLIDNVELHELLGTHTNYNNIHNEIIQNHQNLLQILKKIEFFVLNTILLLIEKRDTTYSKNDADSSIKKTEPQLFYNPKISDSQPDTIVVSKETFKLQEECYVCYSHTIIPNGSHDTYELRILFPSTSENDKYSEIRLYSSEETNREDNRDYLIYKKNRGTTNIKLFLYFYGRDPRPLLICYGNKSYRATSKENYNQYIWKKVINTFPCDSGDKSKLVTELFEVVGFLNSVNIFKQGPSYEVHRYRNEQINIKVTKSEDFGCYRKYVHTPTSGYRLGNLKYDDGQGRSGNLKYSSKLPLLYFGVYYYKNDTNFTEPLVIELEFKNRLTSSGLKVTEYYKLSSGVSSSLTWTEDSNFDSSLKSRIIEYLDKLRFGIKKVVQIQLEHNKNKTYRVNVKPSGDNRGQFSQLNNNISVTQESCSMLEESNYRCLRHNLSSIDVINHHQIGGLKISIPRKLSGRELINSGPYQDISLHKITEGKESEFNQKMKEEKEKENDQYKLYDEIKSYLIPIDPIYYTSCMGDFYVYFYNVTISDPNFEKNVDPRPGLICFNNNAYRPIKLPVEGEDGKYDYTIDENNKWIKVSNITRCSCEEQGKLIEVLNEIYNIKVTNIALIAGSSAGSIAGVGGIAGIIFFIFKKVSSAAVATTVSL